MIKTTIIKVKDIKNEEEIIITNSEDSFTWNGQNIEKGS